MTTTTRIRRIIYVLILCGLILHLKTAFWECADPGCRLSIKLLILSMIPYIIILVFIKASYGALCAAIMVFLFDVRMHLQIFVWSSGSATAAIGLEFWPIVNIVLVIPLSFLVGHFIKKFLFLD